MKRKNTRSKAKHAPGPPRPFRASIRTLPAGSTIRVVSRILLVVIVLHATVRFFTTRDTISISLDTSNRQSWTLKNVRHFEPGAEYFSIECDQPCYVISPSLSHLAINPADDPYVRVIFAPASSLRKSRILLSDPAEPGKFFPRPALAQPTHLIADLRDRQQYASIAPYTSTLERIGVSFTGTMLLSRIEVSAFANLADYRLLLRNALASDEPSTPHAANELSGAYIFGHSQKAWAFAFLFLATLVILSFARAGYLRKISIAVACTVLFLYLPWSMYFFSQLARAAEHSSFRYGMFDEYASRYGEDFASLSRALYDKVPAGSRVHFVRRVIDASPTEGNLAAFVHSIRFEPCEFGDADYYFGCRCPGIYDPARAQLTEPHTGKTAAVAPIYRQNDSFLLKATK